MRSLPVLAIGRGRVWRKLFGKATALGCLANVLERGVQAVVRGLSLRSLGSFSCAAGPARSTAPIGGTVALVLCPFIRVLAGASCAGISLTIRGSIFAVSAPIAAPPSILMGRARRVVRALVVGDCRRLGLFDGKLSIDRGILTDLLERLTTGGRGQALVVATDRRSNLAQSECRITQCVINFRSQERVGTQAGFLIASPSPGVLLELKKRRGGVVLSDRGAWRPLDGRFERFQRIFEPKFVVGHFPPRDCPLRRLGRGTWPVVAGTDRKQGRARE